MEFLEVKEYLDPNDNYSYHKVPAIAKGTNWIEVPEGATFYAEDSNMGVKDNYFFRLRSDDFDGEAIYLSGRWMRASFDVRNMTVLWHRHTQPEELPSVDDEQKQTIEKTLKERQGQYGSFEDVATVTQDLLGILQRTGFNSLPKPHKEALHMICSKMARLVNGDFDHVDSWHDIGGYAKLIEDIIKSEKV